MIDSWLFLLIAECHDAEVDVQLGTVENACLVPLVISMMDDLWRDESGWRNNYTSMANILQNQADAFQLKLKEVLFRIPGMLTLVIDDSMPFS